LHAKNKNNFKTEIAISRDLNLNFFIYFDFIYGMIGGKRECFDFSPIQRTIKAEKPDRSRK
jgi:hypothetical protein